MREAMSDLSAQPGKMPKDREGLQEFLGSIKDSKFGLGVKPVSLLDVLSSYKERQEKDSFDFFEEYYESEVANKNLAKCDEVLEIVYFDEDDKDEESLVNKISFQTNETISKKVVEMFKERYEASRVQENKESNESTDEDKNNTSASE